MGTSFCDPAVIALLREQYDVRETGNIAQTMKHTACNASAKDSHGSVTLPIKNVTVGLSFGSTNTARACTTSEN